MDWLFIEMVDEIEGQFIYAQDLGNNCWRYGIGFRRPDGQWVDMATGGQPEGVTHIARIEAPEMRPFPHGNGPSERRTV